MRRTEVFELEVRLPPHHPEGPEAEGDLDPADGDADDGPDGRGHCVPTIVLFYQQVQP